MRARKADMNGQALHLKQNLSGLAKGRKLKTVLLRGMWEDILNDEGTMAIYSSVAVDQATRDTAALRGACLGCCRGAGFVLDVAKIAKDRGI